MPLVLQAVCPDCGKVHPFAELGAALRCAGCGRDFRAAGEGDGATRIISVTPDEMAQVPYSQRSVELPVNKLSSIMSADPALLADKLLRDAPVKENAKWLGKVRLLKKLGQGGMGAVYRGFEEALALDVAVKVVPLPPDEREQQFVERFQQEARFSAKINHPNVVRTFQVDREGGLLYLVMDYIAGQTARNLVERKGPLPPPLALQIIQDAAKGVHAAHEHGVLHRDIKPDNILVAEDGRVLLTDLGLAKAIRTGSGASLPLTRLGLLLGTPEYMSPEQWDIGSEAGRTSDIWSLGATFWMLLTGSPPFSAPDLSALARSIKEAPLADIRLLRPDLPAYVPPILKRCLAKTPGDRFASCSELLAAFEKPDPPQESNISSQASSKISVNLIPNPVSEREGALAYSEMATVPGAPKKERDLDSISLGRKGLEARPVARVAILAMALAAAAGAAWYGLRKKSVNSSAPIVSLERSCTHVAPGEESRLLADLGGISPSSAFAVIWIAETKAYCGRDVRVVLDHDEDFQVNVRDLNTGKLAAQRELKVLADLRAHAAKQDYYRITSGTQFTLEGWVEGGPRYPNGIEARWLVTQVPDSQMEAAGTRTLPEPRIFTPTASQSNFSEEQLVLCSPGRTLAMPALKAGQYILIFQVKRIGELWTQAAADKVVAEIIKTVPPEFTAAMNEASEARLSAGQAESGAEALAFWRKAMAALRRGAGMLADSVEVKTQTEDCAQQIALNEKYAALLDEGARLATKAEQMPQSDGLGRLAAWAEALQPCTTALALFDRAEARAQAAAAREKLAALKVELAAAEQERSAFDALITQARSAAKEAGKFAAPAVALPYWERAASGFEELARRFPQRSGEFTLEFKDTQENRDKAFLYEKLGVVPEQKGKGKQ